MPFALKLLCCKELDVAKDIVDFVRPALKLVHIALSNAIHQNSKPLLNNLAENLNDDIFTNLLKEIKSDETQSDIHKGIEKILELINKVTEKESSTEDLPPESLESLETKKSKSKEMMKQRME